MKKTVLNQDWLFWKEGHESEATMISIPHDAMLTEGRIPNMENGSASGFYPGGKYYYKKMLYFGEENRGKTILVEFEGIYMDSSVYLNGIKVGGHLYGYTNFYVDLTDAIKYGEENELLVVADNSKTPNSRWYSGSGIYRPVNLYTAGLEYIKPEGVRITTESIEPASLHVTVEAKKSQDTEIIVSIQTNGKEVTRLSSTEDTEKDIYDLGKSVVPDAKLWSAEQPYLYDIVVELRDGNRVIDTEKFQYGIRTLSWNATHGFRVNGNIIKLKGGCVHHDNGPLGAATNDKAEYRKLKKMKEVGYNAVRYAHNPAGKNFLSICDELGLYVMDETFDQWKIPQSTYDYATHFDTEWEGDLEALIRKDYNHSSVIMYCVGNEITDTGLPHGAAICKMLCAKIKSLDNSRPITIAINSMLSVLADMQAKKAQAEAAMSEEEKNAAKEKQVGSKEVNDIITLLPKIMASITPESLENLIHDVVEAVDIVGYNYGENLYHGIHELAPNRVLLSAETFPSQIGEHWAMIEDTDYVIGDFMWTAWDYLGEAGVGLPFYGTESAPFSKAYPCLTAGCGSIDLTGYVESQGKYTSVVFGSEKKPCIAVRPLDHAGELYTLGKWRFTDAVRSWSWSGQEGKNTEIEIYSCGTEVELFQTIGGDKSSLGRKELVHCLAKFETIYQPGELEAVSYDESDNEIGRKTLQSANSNEEKLQLKAEESVIRADGMDLAYIQIAITDEAGVVHSLKDRKVTVTVEGAGKLIALASGNPETTERFSDSSYTTYHGRLIAIVQSEEKIGNIIIRASAEGMESVSICVSVK